MESVYRHTKEWCFTFLKISHGRVSSATLSIIESYSESSSSWCGSRDLVRGIVWWNSSTWLRWKIPCTATLGLDFWAASGVKTVGKKGRSALDPNEIRACWPLVFWHSCAKSACFKGSTWIVYLRAIFHSHVKLPKMSMADDNLCRPHPHDIEGGHLPCTINGEKPSFSHARLAGAVGVLCVRTTMIIIYNPIRWNR